MGDERGACGKKFKVLGLFCGECRNETFLISYDVEEEVMYADCAECGRAVMQYYGKPDHKITPSCDECPENMPSC